MSGAALWWWVSCFFLVWRKMEHFTKGNLCPAFRQTWGGRKDTVSIYGLSIAFSSKYPYGQVEYFGMAYSDPLHIHLFLRQGEWYVVDPFFFPSHIKDPGLFLTTSILKTFLVHECRSLDHWKQESLTVIVIAKLYIIYFLKNLPPITSGKFKKNNNCTASRM